MSYESPSRHEADMPVVPTMEQAVSDDARQIFAAHVQRVARYGDAVDAHRRYIQTDRVRFSIAAFGAFCSAGALAAGQAEIIDNFGLALGTTAFTTAALLANTRIKNVAAGFWLLSQWRGEKIGQQYELYRVPLIENDTKTQHIAMYWGGAYEATSGWRRKPTGEPAPGLRQSLVTIAQLAKDNAINTVLIDGVQLSEVLPQAGNYAERIGLADEWLKNAKGIKLDFYEGNVVVNVPWMAFTPEGLQLLARSLPSSEAQARGINQVIESLRKVQPEHPLVRTYDANSFDYQALQRVARHSVERHLNELTARFDRSDDAQRIPLRTKVYRQGKLNGMHVEWQIPGEATEVQASIPKALGLKEDNLEEMLLDTSRAQQLIQAAEYLVYRNCMDDGKGEGAPDSQQFRAVSALPQATIINSLHYYGAKRVMTPGDVPLKIEVERRRAALRNCLSLALGCAIGVGVNMAVEGVADNYVQAYAATTGRVMDDLSDPELNYVNQQLDATNRYIGGYRGLRQYAMNAFIDLDNTADRLLGKIDKESADEDLLDTYKHLMTGSGLGASKVGNLYDPSTSPVIGNVSGDREGTEWALTSHGLSAAGYWTAGTSSTLTENGIWLKAEYSKYVLSDRVDIPVLIDPADKHYIEVEGHVRTQQTFLDVPVLNGTVPVAANLAGLPVKLVTGSDGTYGLDLSSAQNQITDDVYSRLVYYLAPRLVDNPSTGRQNVMQEHGYRDPIDIREDTIKAWDRIRGGVIDDPEARLLSDIRYTQGFQYSYAPLNQKMNTMLSDGVTNWGTFVDNQLWVGKTNCNVNATIIAADNPDVSVAWGYLNSPPTSPDDAASNYLETKESHMWNIDLDGTIYDGTPSASVTDKPPKVPMAVATAGDSAVEIDGLPVPPFALYAAGASTFLAGAIRRRHPLVRKAKTIRAAVAREFVDTYDARKLATTKLVVDHIQYAPAVQPSVIKQQVTNVDRHTALRAMRLPQMQTSGITKNLGRAAAKQTDKQARRQLRQARRIIRTVQWARLHTSERAANPSHSF